MEAVDIILQYGSIHFVYIKYYRYIRMRVSVVRNDYALTDKLYITYGGCVSHAKYVHRWEASHVGDIRLVALDVLERVSTGRLSRIMDMVLQYCNTVHGGRSKVASSMFESFGVGSIKLRNLEE